MRPYVGEDGRLYFNYCQGAEYLYEKTKHISVGDRFDDGLISLLSYSGKINTVNVKRNCYNYTDL